MNSQQLNDYYYGYNLRLADELGEFYGCINQPASLEGKIKVTNHLKRSLVANLHEDSVSTLQKRERYLFEEVFNDPIDEREQEFYPEYQ